MTRSSQRSSDPEQAAAVLTKATLRAAALLDLNDVHLGTIIGVSPSSVSRLHKSRAIEPDTKEGQLAVLFLRMFRSLDACFGAVEAYKRWLWAPNQHVRGTPAELIQSPEGLVNVIRYLDAVRGSSNRRALESRPWRVAGEQHPSSTWKLVDSKAEHDLLEQLIDAGKPPLPLGPAFEGLHALLAAPFRYPPLEHGSRFGSVAEPSLWYGSEELRTALAEDAYYRLYVNAGSSAHLAPFTLARLGYQVHLRTRSGVDLTAPPFDGHAAALCSTNSYAATQAIGSRMRAEEIQAFRFASARDVQGGVNVGVFGPEAFASKKILGAPQTWQCTVTEAGVAYECEAEAHFFPVADYLIDGELLVPTG